MQALPRYFSYLKKKKIKKKAIYTVPGCVSGKLSSYDTQYMLQEKSSKGDFKDKKKSWKHIRFFVQHKSQTIANKYYEVSVLLKAKAFH